MRGPRHSGYTLGITLFVNADGTLGLFENGLRQNVLFLYRLFKSAPGCSRVYLLAHGEAEAADIPADLGIDPADVVRTLAVADQLDAVIVAGAAMDRETAMRLRDRGCRVIAYKGGNGAVISMEAMVARPPRSDAERYVDHDDYDAIWMTPQHVHTYKGWCETIYRCPVTEVPQLWAPLLIKAARPAVRQRFGYQPGRRPWRIGVLDPNVTVMKTSHMPMLVCEAAFRRCPQAFQAIYITNGQRHRENAHFASFALSLSAVQARVMTLEPRFVGVEFLANHCDAVVTHQWENGLNYLYYEALYGGYPLIHNSNFLVDQGYAYPDFDAEGGGEALLSAWDHHDQALEDHRSRAAEMLAKLDPEAGHNIALHESLLLATGGLHHDVGTSAGSVDFAQARARTTASSTAGQS